MTKEVFLPEHGVNLGLNTSSFAFMSGFIYLFSLHLYLICCSCDRIACLLNSYSTGQNVSYGVSIGYWNCSDDVVFCGFILLLLC